MFDAEVRCPRFLQLLAFNLCLLPAALAAGPPVSDGFNTASLDTSVWSFVNPVGDGSYSLTGSALQLVVPAGTDHDLWSGGERAVRVVQQVSNGDFDIQAKFLTSVGPQYQMEGLLVEQDSSNYLRFDLVSGATTTNPRAFSARIVNGAATAMIDKAIGTTTTIWLRVKRTGSTFTFSWSKDGVTFTTAGTYSQTLTVNRVGVYAGNSGSPAPAFTATVDSFQSYLPDLTLTKSHTGSFTQSGTGSYSLVATNSGSAPTAGTVTVTDTLPTGLTPTTASGSTWTCSTAAQTVTCTSTSVVAAGAAFPTITLGVTVAANAPASVTNVASVAGGGEADSTNDSASDPTTINAVVLPPDLTISKSHAGNFTQGGTGAYAIVVANAGAGPTSGTVTMTDTLPTGLTPTAASGNGWTCGISAQVVTCTNTTAVAAATAFPAITVAVNVAANAPASVTNTASVSGGGETNTANNSASDPTTINASGTPDLTITKSHTGNFTQGGTGSYAVTVTNSGTAVTSGTVTVADTVPTGLTPTAASGNGWTCGISAQVVTCTNTTAVAAATAFPAITVAVNIAANAPASVTNTASVSGGGETNTSNNSASDPTTINASGTPDLTITKSHTGNFTQGGTGSYAVTATNSGTAVTSGTVTVTDTLPTGLTPTAASGNGWTCGISAQVVTCTNTTAVAAATAFPAITLAVNVAANAPASVTNTASVSGGGETNTSNNSASDPTTINASGTPDLTITKSHTGNFTQGGTGSYAITATNSGTAVTSGTVTVTDTVPTGLTPTAASGNGWTCGISAQVVTCTNTTAVAAATAFPAITVAVNIAANAPASVTNTASVSGGGETNTSNNSASDPTTINASGTPDLTITKSHTGNFTQGGTGSYAITATNSGTAVTSGTVTVTDTLPTGLTPTAASGNGWTCGISAQVVTCTNTTAVAAATAFPAITVAVNVAANAPASVTNTASVSGGGETNTANNSASDPTTINASGTPDLTITKSHTGNFTQGGTGSYAVTVTNSGTAVTSGTVTVADTVPTGLTPTAASGNGWTCGISAQVVTCTNTTAVAAATAFPAITVAVNVAANAPASVTNTASVSGGGETNTSNNSASDPTTIMSAVLGPPQSDGFNTTTLDPSVWTFVNPLGDGSYQMTGTTLQLIVPGGTSHDMWTGGENGVRVVQPVANADFDIQAKFDTTTGPQYQEQGLLIEQDGTNYIRYDLVSGSTASNPRAFSAKIVNGVATSMVDKAIGSSTSIWLRAKRAGSTFTLSWSKDGVTYTTAGSYSLTLTVNRVGVYAGNAGSPAPAFTASVDYFQNNVPDLTLTKTHSGNFTQGSAGTYTLTATNAGNVASSGTITITDTLPTGLTPSAAAGNGWTCSISAPTVTCTTTASAAPAASLPAINLSVSVAPNAPASLTNTATVSGGGETNTANNSASDLTTIVSNAAPDLILTKSHSGNFTQGGTGSYTLTASNAGTATTSGTITVTDTVPTGLTPTAASGNGWTCGISAQVVTCTNATATAAASALPSITLTVSVAANAPASVTNTASVSGGGETNTANNAASDPTTITASTAPDMTLTKSHTGSFTQGGTGSYTLTATNSGASTTSGTITVTDTVPTGLTPTAASGNGWTCGISAQVVTCTSSTAVAASTALPAITLAVSVAANAPASVTNNASVSGGGETNTSNNSASDVTTIGTVGPSDDFHSGPLNTTLWTFVNPVGDGSYQMTGSNLLLRVPAGTSHDLWVGGNNSVRVVQNSTNTDFRLQAKFDSTQTAGYQSEGILVEQDGSNYLRFDQYFDGSTYWMFAAAIIGGSPSVKIGVPITTSTPVWIDVTRAGNTFTMKWSTNGSTFSAAGSFSQALTVNRVGVFAGNSGPCPAFVASVDYFFNMASPISPEDGGGPGITMINVAPTASNTVISWTTDRTATTQVQYGLTAAYGSSTTLDTTLVTSHSATLTGLVCNSTYHYSVTSTDGSSNTIASPDATFVPPCGSVGAPASDDFTSATLNTSTWTFVNPLNDGGSYSLNGNSILLSVPAGNSHDLWTGGNQSVRVMQAIANADFEVEAKFSSAVNIQSPYQIQGIVVEQDASNFLRFSMHSDNLRQFLFVAVITGSTSSIIANQEIRGGPATWMRVKRTGNTWALSYSYDSLHWTPAVTFTQALTVSKVGPCAGNASYNSASAPAFTAIVDHFVNRQNPPSTIDGAAYPPTPASPVINVWYGDTQTFGQVGVPQQWVNILGDVSSFDQVTSLTYSLNGGSQQTLWMGENVVRLVAPGLFNVEIDYASLLTGTNTVQITATDAVGRQTTHNVTVNYVPGQSWPRNYTADWSTTSNLQSLAQVVDGNWQIQSDGTVRIMQTGYDRLLAIGDRTTWQNFVVTAQLTINSLDAYGYGVGIVVGWQGHTTLQYGQPLPDQPRTGHPFPGLAEYSAGDAPPSLNIFQNTAAAPEMIMVRDTSGRTLQTGVKYNFKFQCQQNSSGGTHYSFKVWPVANAEPSAWDLETDGDLSLGSILLIAHRADVSFGLVTVTGL